jgi:hypothetical protein
MIDRKTITLPVTMPLHQRISEAARQIRVWVQSYNSEFDPTRDQLRLVGCVKRNGMFRYTYEFLSKTRTSPPDENGAGKEANS